MDLNKIKLRNAEICDIDNIIYLKNLPEVLEVSNGGFKDSEYVKILKRDINKYRIIYIYDTKEIIGYIAKINNEISICLDREYRNRDIGTYLLNKENGTAIITLNNPRSLRCFTKSGWIIKGFYLEKKV